MNRDALNDRPFESVRTKQRVALSDILSWPRFTCWNMVERSDNTGGASLHDLLETDGVIGAKPSPSFLHAYLVRKFDVMVNWSGQFAKAEGRR